MGPDSLRLTDTSLDALVRDEQVRLHRRTLRAATAGSLAAQDAARLGLLRQLESVFPTGEQGVGHAAGQLSPQYLSRRSPG